MGADPLVAGLVQAHLAVLACLNSEVARELLLLPQMVAGRQLGECSRMRGHQHGRKLAVAVELQLKHIKVVAHQHGVERTMEAALHMAVGTEAERHTAVVQSMAVVVEEYVTRNFCD